MGFQPGQVVIAEGYILSENLLEILLDKVDRLDIFFVSIKNDGLLHMRPLPCGPSRICSKLYRNK